MLETQQLRHRLSCPKGASILSEETDNEQTSEMANMTSGNEKCYKYLVMIKNYRVAVLTRAVKNRGLNETRKDALWASGGRETGSE